MKKVTPNYPYFLMAMSRVKNQADKNLGDREEDHIEADQILCDLLHELGYDEIVETFKQIPKWYA